jgi:ABC-type molybdate transport system substrate-binding protein
MVLLKRASAIAERFYEFLQQPSAREVFQRYGFSIPDD